ncbi:MATE family efflux transporter [Oceanirhabdus sp. W0125-5]|uniref:MATE family efflux transporter n=1 Tax=Oceanirhabdus sp. W0125-5 TaxID=2999116 RepID=UPI0022F327E1|nr:MATE family efflux transporter [Oceanirhabdus sp. W0125-5]WBW96227.1 MATE family efflux transporter [Oceanirhabdus sp. W0125-5]
MKVYIIKACAERMVKEYKKIYDCAAKGGVSNINNDVQNTTNIDFILNEKPIKVLVKLGIPAILMALLDELNSFIDAIFMGQYFGSDAVSSMSIILPIMLLMVAFGTLFSEGTSIAIGRYLGAKNIQKANEYLTNTVVITAISSAVCGVIFYFLTPVVIRIFDVSEGVRYFADIYLRILSLGMPIFMLVIVLAKNVYTEGKTSYLLITTFIQLGLNIIINYVLIGILRFGVKGAALGTLLSELLQISMLIKYINSNKMAMKFSFKELRLNKAYFKEVISLGLPIFLSMILLAITMGIESKIIAKFGTAALSVQTITGYAFSISSSIAGGIMSVSVVILSYSVGAKKIKRFYEILKYSVLVVFIVVTSVNLILVINSSLVVRMFTNSSNVINLIKIPALIYGLTAPLIFTTNVVLYAMQPVGMEKTSSILFALQQVLMFMPLLFILKEFGLVCALSAQPLSEVIGGIITIILIPLFIKRTNNYFIKKKEVDNT